MSVKRKHYSDEEKMSLLRQYYESGMSKYGFCRQNGIYSISMFNQWLLKWPSAEKALSLPATESPSTMPNRSKEDYKDENAQLKKRIKELEKALAYSKLETEARDLMINRAEAYFNIPIRKKSGAK